MAETVTPPNLDGLVEKFIEGFYDPKKLQRLQAAMANAQSIGVSVASGADAAARQELAASAEEARGLFEEVLGGFSAWIMSVAVETAFGVEVDQSAFYALGAKGSRQAVASALTAKMVEALTGGSKSVEPSAAPAARYLDVVLGQQFEAWVVGTLVEIGSCALPFLEQIQTVGDIGNRVVNALGIGDSSSRVLRPYIDTLVVEPLRQHIAKQYRPTQLSPSEIIRQFIRGTWKPEQFREHMARHGYTDEAADALLESAAKKPSGSEVKDYIELGIIPDETGVSWLQNDGWQEGVAKLVVEKWRAERERAYASEEVAAGIRAYINREIPEAFLSEILDGSVPNAEIREAARVYADMARDLNVKRLTHGEIRECVERGIATRREYRDWLAREGYEPEDALRLELLLEAQLRGQSELAAARKRREEEIAAERAEREREKAARAAELAAKRARTFPALGDLERMVIRGVLPMDAYASRLADLKYAPADVAALVELLRQDREKYLADQERRQAAEGALLENAISLADLERAVLFGIVTIDDYRRRLEAEELPAGDIGVLVELLRAELDERRRAADARELAAARLADRALSLGQLEKAVRQGLRSPLEYETDLRGQGFSVEEAALLRASLVRDIADATADAARRAEANRRAEARGIGLAALERAVKLGVRPIEDYAAKLVELQISPEDQITLLGVLRAELARLDAARQVGADGTRTAPARELARGDMEKAVLEGLRSIDEYRAWLATVGYRPDDRELLAELLIVRILAKGDAAAGG